MINLESKIIEKMLNRERSDDAKGEPYEDYFDEYDDLDCYGDEEGYYDEVDCELDYGYLEDEDYF